MTVDDALAFLISFMLSPRPSDGYPSFGYEIYIPNVIASYLLEVEKPQIHHSQLRNSSRAREISPLFYEAAWSLCRRGVLRPGVKALGAQAAGEGDGYSVTSAGKNWLDSGAAADLIVDTSRLSAIFQALSANLGSGFLQRATEAARCHDFGCYLASCAMCGAAAELVLLAIATAKSSDEEATLRTYQSAKGRRQTIDAIVGQARPAIANPFRNAMGLLSYWRDDASHGTASNISEIEAHEALGRLLRLAQFVQDNWAEITKS